MSRRRFQALTPYPDSPKEVADATELIYNILKDYYQQEEEQKQAQQQTPCQQGDSSKSDDSEANITQSNDDEGQISEGKNESATTSETVFDDAQFEEDLQPIAAVIIEEITSENDSDVNMADCIVRHPVEAEVMQGSIEKGSERETYFQPQKNNHKLYQKSKDDVSAYASTLKKLIELSFQDKIITSKGMRSGLLDTGKFPEASMGVSNIYQQHRRIKSNELAIGVLVDESGSMAGQKIESARKCATLFNEAFHKSPWVELFVYGHSADMLTSNATEIFIYKEPRHNPKYAIGSIQSRYMNRDGTAILQTAKRIRKFTEKKGILFVISDGEPAAEKYSGRAAIEHTRKSVEAAEKLGFVVIQIAIENDIHSKDMFKNYVELTNISNLPRDLAKLAKKAIQKFSAC